MKMRRIPAVAAVFACGAAGLAGLLAAADTITVKGSDTMVILGQRWAEEYMKAKKDVTIQVTGGGSGTGIAALINGTTTLANSSRPIKAEEKEAAKKNGSDVVEFKTAMDALAVVVSASNPVDHLTMQQVGKIYTGYISNWKQVGGPDKRILRYTRESNSGTYVFFKEHVLNNRDYAADAQTMPGTSAVAEAVAKDPAGIGFGGVAYFAGNPKIKILKIAKDDKSAPISPLLAGGKVNFDAVWSETYPIARYLYVYSAGQPKGAAKEYLDWILGPEGQKIVEKIEYVPMPGEARAERAAAN
ncbi:MAG: PstS family phosphate ABC transporter substrate-binding protein [Acidobacteria bacterium]|nr:PstS family phosphate ABC transporter substrate-binding protein [Acidobacteriota bacterium]